MSGIRFTAYLTRAEREALRDAAHKEGTSENLLVRLALRRLFGLPLAVLPTDKTDETLTTTGAK